MSWYESHLNELLNEFSLQLVVYDEIEQYREWNEKLFQYPFQNRKTLAEEFFIDYEKSTNQYDYTYKISK